MSRASRIVWGVLMAILLIVIGGFREMIFININEQIAYNNQLIEQYRVLDIFSFLNDFNNPELGRLKWILTISFTLLFLILGIIVFRYILQDKLGVRWLVIAYIAAFIISAVFFLGGKLLGDSALGYTVSRVFMGALQSPFIMMLMIPARRLLAS